MSGILKSSSFQTLSLIVIGVGVIFTIIFHIGTNESSPNDDLRHEDSPLVGSVKVPMKWRDWIKEVQFYQVSL